jgi:hypothetical protein
VRGTVNYTIQEERLKAGEFYEKLGMTRPKDVMVYDKIYWTEFTVE